MTSRPGVIAFVAVRALLVRRSAFQLASHPSGTVKHPVGARARIRAPSTVKGLAWLDDELSQAPRVPTLLATHHPPFATGVPAWDELGLPIADRRALAAVVARHGQVRRVAAGHVHRMISSDLGGRPVLSVPSTYFKEG